MVLCNMYFDESSYTYEFHGHLDPKVWDVHVADGRLFVEAHVPFKTRGGDEQERHFCWDTKLTRKVKPDAPFKLEPGSYFPGNEKGDHSGGTLKIVFER